MPPTRLTSYQPRMGSFRGRTRTRQILSALVLTTAGMMLLHTFRPTQSFVSDPMGAAMRHGPSFIPGSKRKPGFNPALKDVWDDEDEAELDIDWGAQQQQRVPPPPPSSPKQVESKLPSHVYRSDGLVEVNPEGRHPIYDLIARAEAEWKSKLDKQSRHLADAVEEYERRYKRPPPPGFDKWWDYATAHKVQLLDDYDSIHNDLEPFWGVAPHVLRQTQKDWEKQVGTYTLASENGRIRVGAHTLAEQAKELLPRADMQISLLSEVARWLPDFRATFTAHDGPYQFVARELKDAALDAVKHHTHLDQGSVPHRPYSGWLDGCPANSSLHVQLSKQKWDVRPDMEARHSAPKTLIHDHLASMDPCQHPDLVHINGFLAAHGQGAGVRRFLVPAFALCTTPLHSDIRTIPIEMWTEDVGIDPVWEDKADERVLWRGSNTGIVFGSNQPWNISQRARLIKLTNELEGKRSVLRPVGPDRPIGQPVQMSSKEMNERMMDIAFAGNPIQCEEPVCTEMKDIFEYRGRMEQADANRYKYVLDIDGNGWSARFKRLMTTNSMILKTTIFPEWYMDRVMPWVHYVPVKVDLTDLYDIMEFFRGDAQGQGGHDDLARKIGLAGKIWSKTFYRKEDMIAYLFRLFLEYARVMDMNRDNMGFHLDE